MFRIDQEREGQIDQALVKNVLDIYTEMEEGSIEHTIVPELPNWLQNNKC